MVQLIGGIAVDGGAQRGAEPDTLLSGRPVDTTGNIIPTQKTQLQPLGATGVPNLPTPQDTTQGNAASGDGSQIVPTDGGTGGPPLIVPPPAPQTPGVNLDTMTPRTTMATVPTGPAQDTGTPSSGLLQQAMTSMTDGGYSPAPMPPLPDSFGSPAAPTPLAATTPPAATPGAANPDTGTAPPTTSANVTGIDPNDDLRDKMITPATDSLTEAARQNMADANENLSSFDRGGALDAALAKYSANPSLTAPVDPGKDVSSLLNSADQSTQDALTKLNGTDRQGLANELSSNYLSQLGNTDVTAQPAVDPGKDVSSLLDSADATSQAQLAKLNGTDRQTLADQLFSNYQSKLGPTAVQAGGAISTAPSDRLKSLQDQVDQATSGLNSVDRVALAKQMYDTFAQSTDPQYQLMMRQATQKAAATGGLGSGGLRTDYGNLTNQRAQDLTTKQNELIQQAVSDSVNDALNKQSRLASLEGQLSGEEASQRAEQRTDRQYATDVSTGNVNRGLAANESAAGLAGQNADADLSSIEQALAASRGVSGDLANRQQQRTANQMENRNYATSVDTSNVDRGLAAKENALTMGSTNANDDVSAINQALAASRGVSGDLAGRQQQFINNQQTNRATALAQANTDRNFADQFTDQKAGDLANSLTGASGVFNNTAAQEANNRNELRTERTYQTGQEQSAFERSLAEYEAEQQAKQQQFTNGLNLLNTSSTGNPANTLANLGAQSGTSADDIMKLIESLNTHPPTTTSTTATGATGGSDTSGITDALKALGIL